METPILTNAFLGKEQAPNSKALATALGESGRLWSTTLKRLSSECGVEEQEWRAVPKKGGWVLRLQKDGRTIVYLCPYENAFGVVFLLGGKAMEAARAVTLPPSVLRAFAEAKHYAEGNEVRFEVGGDEEISAVVKLAGLKLATGARKATAKRASRNVIKAH